MRQLTYGEAIYPIQKTILRRQRAISWAGKCVRYVREAEIQLPPAENQTFFDQRNENRDSVEAETVGTVELLLSE